MDFVQMAPENNDRANADKATQKAVEYLTNGADSDDLNDDDMDEDMVMDHEMDGQPSKLSNSLVAEAEDFDFANM